MHQNHDLPAVRSSFTMLTASQLHPVFRLAICGLLVLSASLLQAAEGEADRWFVGYAEADITPLPGEAFMLGFGRERYVQGTHDPLRAQAVVLKDSRGKIAVLVTADLLGFCRGSVDAMRHRIKKAHGLEAEAVLFSASHTHWGPAVSYQVNFALGGLNVWYLERLERRILELVDEAIANLSPASVSFCDCQVSIGVNRRKQAADGSTQMLPNPEGSYDRHTPVIRIVRSGSPRQVLLVAHGCHPTSSGPLEEWSADYPGMMRKTLESKLEDCRVAFLQGCGGNVKVAASGATEKEVVFAASLEQSAAAGVKLAEAVEGVLSGEKLTVLSSHLVTTMVRGHLSLQPQVPRSEITKQAYEGDPRNHLTWWARQTLAYSNDYREFPYVVQLWKLGELSLFALEGEVVTEWGPRVRAMANTPHAMVVGYANHVGGYIPTREIIEQGGYEGFLSHKAYFLPAPFAPEMEGELEGLLRLAIAKSSEAAAAGTNDSAP
jgi:neutral ceramidase